MIDRRLISNFDWWLLLLVLLITGIGIANIQSASMVYKVSGITYTVKQIYWVTAGGFLALLVCSADFHIFEDVSYWLYGFIIVLLAAVLLIGKTSMGATRWLNLGLFNVQPSELMKPVIIITIARYFSLNTLPEGMWLSDIIKPLLLTVVPALLIIKQPDLGTAVLLLLISFSIMFYVGIRISTWVWMTTTLAPLLFLTWKFGLRDYQKNRVLNFIDPERDPLGSGYHIIQSKIAIGSGGFLGKGYMQGTQTQLRFLPEQHTDFAFSVFAEEWGFAGCFVLIMLYILLIMWGLQTAKHCNDRFGSLLAVGVTSMIFWHSVINMGMVIGLFPVVGVPLPFFSYGGTSMITSMTGIGILLSIRMRRFMF